MYSVIIHFNFSLSHSHALLLQYIVLLVYSLTVFPATSGVKHLLPDTPPAEVEIMHVFQMYMYAYKIAYNLFCYSCLF